MKNIFNISRRATGTVDNGTVTITKLHSFDFVGNPGFSGANMFDSTNDLLLKIQKELQRQELLENRRKKIEHLNKISE